MYYFIFLACLAVIPTIKGQATEGTSFVVAFPRTGGDFDALLRMTAREETSYTIESSTETRQGTIPGMSSVTEVYPMEQRVTYGVETVGLIVTTDNPISVHLDQPSWELDVAMARPIDDDDTEFYVVTYLYSETTGSNRPLSFYYVAASEDDTNVEILNNEGRKLVEVTLDRFDVLSEDASEYTGGSDIDFTGVYVRSDKPVGVFTGHGRVRYPDNNNNNYIFDSMPNTAELGTSFTTFPLIFGPDDSGSVLRVMAVTDDTVITIDSLGVSESVNAGDYYELEHRESYDARKVECSAPCYVVQFTIATTRYGGAYDAMMGGGMVPITPDRDFGQEFYVATPYLENPDDNYVAIAIIADTYPVDDIYINDVNVNEIESWVQLDDFAYVSFRVSSFEPMFHIESRSPQEEFTAYLYTNIKDVPGGTKSYSAGVV